MHHGGEFGGTISQTYIGGSVCSFDYCHGAELSMLELSTMVKELGYGFDSRFYHKLSGQFVLLQADKEIMNLADARRVVHIYMENEVVVGTQESQICSNILRPTSGKDLVNEEEDEDSDEYDLDSSSSENDSNVVFNDNDYNFTDDDDDFEANVDDDVEYVGLSCKAEIDQSYAETTEKLANIDGDCDGGSSSELSSGETSCDEQVGQSKKVKFQVFNEKIDMQNPRFAIGDNVFRVKRFVNQHTCTRTYHVEWKEWTCKVSLTRVYRAKQKALDLIEETTNEQFGMIYAYAEEIMKSDPGT
ncbi:hypothetical protein RHSIM_Rhsim01G0148900 [Rhododendron simsii]|uniref:PB1-like domain-containing protein n=1 Tax=Rhododendron simsii TaxID=118357 RepID=A0A834LUQ6_RHOSS|nr:hypothetical protein RHSIM_Rhsim01G0148900 [Rhododendron simsii]